jgi:membrane-bound serine protease (ClpP class)
VLLATATTPTGTAVLLPVKGPIGPATSDFFVRKLAEAGAANAAVDIVTIDTPGGLDTAMRDMIQAILAAEVPVVAYVSPSGARAASAAMALSCRAGKASLNAARKAP